MQYSIKPAKGYGIKYEKVTSNHTLALVSGGTKYKDDFRVYSLCVNFPTVVPCNLFLGEIFEWAEKEVILKLLSDSEWMKKQPWQLSVSHEENPYGLGEFHKIWIEVIKSSKNIDKWRAERIAFHQKFRK